MHMTVLTEECKTMIVNYSQGVTCTRVKCSDMEVSGATGKVSQSGPMVTEVWVKVI